ncbi:hypothetical protein K4A83_08740 [Spirulina subsalsa FACHB-351]|uniref:Uncharacterized protein n=1 Tax=Spirulina subsalsa FACHB-351 TaxID=234711 RepID=A0ABT3L4B8_9CYAN|nr:hypothetical protein [Spirulina subsalsa]MCW6036356.1 hypothetical protein [Spirulina subsalsa FACHB-351]
MKRQRNPTIVAIRRLGEAPAQPNNRANMRPHHGNTNLKNVGLHFIPPNLQFYPEYHFTSASNETNTTEWHFENEAKYQEFLEWFLAELNDDKKTDESETLTGGAEINLKSNIEHQT